MSNATANTTTTCPPGDQIPAIGNLPIPTGIAVVAIPGSNISDHAMVTCCAPRPVNIANGCYEWCQVTDANITNFTSCLDLNGRDNSSTVTTYRHSNAAGTAAATVTVAQIGLWALFVSSVSVLFT
ncbi:hypothetical protein Sste5346_004694 [Sporothrix stenoceras]|uniref:Uncharacterized protein n=1 Tax=Sporothrix stenoceras TaxID=5173 RepID=A0ABR3Z6Q1_9PEZI